MTLVAVTDRQAYKDSRSIVKVTDANYKTFKRLRVSRSIDDVCGEFKITISRPVKSQSPFKIGNTIDIQLNENQIMRGRIYTTSLEGDAFSDDITIAGRDITGDLIDSTVPDDSKVYSEGVNIFDIAGKIIRSMGLSNQIGVINSSGSKIEPFTEEEIVACKTGQTAISFLQKYCRKRQLFLNTDNVGNLVFFKAAGIKTGNNLINLFSDSAGSNRNNVIDYRTKYDISSRFGLYTCKAQSADGWGNNEVDAEGSTVDLSITGHRVLEIKMEEESSSSAECKKRAQEESNVRRARGFEYRVVVQGFGDRLLWGTNQFVTVRDERSGISGEFLIKAVKYKIDNSKGRTTKLTITNKDAYTTQAAISLRDAQQSDAGLGWIND